MNNADLLAVARAAARAGARALAAEAGPGLRVEQKGSFDFVTNADRRAEEAVLAVIRERCPDHAVLAEESAGYAGKLSEASGVLWVVDPLDGTTNFIHGFPHYAVSVAALAEGRLAAGVVLDATRGEEFAAAAGGGAWLDGRPMTVSSRERRDQSLLLTGFPFRDKDRLEPYLELFAEVFRETAGVRRAGSAALDLAYVAAGRAEGFWEMGLKPWDLAAGMLLVTEAGGVVTDFSGGDNSLWRGDIAAAAPAMHGFLQRACANRFPEG